ncbi:hypothetical protein Bca4012_071692 [Brassica carinata]
MAVVVEDLTSSEHNEPEVPHQLGSCPDGGVYASFDLFNYPWYLGTRNLLLRRCYEEGNPSTFYVKGVEYFYWLDRLDEGLRLLKRAVDAGYERALYTYAMTRKILWEDEEYFSRFTR